MIRVQAPGKMILIGEYAVLEGAPGLVAAVDRFARVSVVANKGNEFVVHSPALGLHSIPFVVVPSGGVRYDPHLPAKQQKVLNLFTTVFESLWQLLSGQKERRLPELRITLETEDFYSGPLKTKLGFGSSAALTVAITKAVFDFIDLDTDAERTLIFQQSLKAHRQAQNNRGSGIDIAASSYGGVLSYTFNPQHTERSRPQPMPLWPGLNVLPVWTGRSASTLKMVERVHKLKQKDGNRFERLMGKLGELSHHGCQAFEKQAVSDFFEAVRTFNATLNALGQASDAPIITGAHERLAQLASQFDAVYKPSGAGGGDIGVAFFMSDESLKRFKEAISAEGMVPLDVQICSGGVQQVN